MLADEQPDPKQYEIYRQMTPQRRLALAESLCWSARKMKAAWLRSLHKDWTEIQISKEVACIFSNART